MNNLPGPLRHARELSSARTTTGPPPRPSALGRQRTCPPSDWLFGGRATGGWFPRSPLDHSFREVPSYIPVASPRLRRRPSPWPPARPLQPGPELTIQLPEEWMAVRYRPRPAASSEVVYELFAGERRGVMT